MSVDLGPLGQKNQESSVSSVSSSNFSSRGHLLKEAFPDTTPQTRVQSLVIDSQSSLIAFAIRYSHRATEDPQRPGLYLSALATLCSVLRTWPGAQEKSL